MQILKVVYFEHMGYHLHTLFSYKSKMIDEVIFYKYF